MRLSNEVVLYGVLFVLCFIGTHAGFGQAREQRDAGLKTYSGQRVNNSSLRMVYFYDQTVAVVELGPKKLLLNCELIEVYEPEEALKSLGELQKVSRPVAISFPEMMTLMSQCQQVDSFRNHRMRSTSSANSANGRSSLLNNNPLTLLSGIIPGKYD
ncbi:Phospholipase A2 [Popillia japonica]|uniref:Phospholipase A2 n=1 Tax=Popillia japonica TaxID=7064 RepID=A0AAW1LTU0_POPJA